MAAGEAHVSPSHWDHFNTSNEVSVGPVLHRIKAFIMTQRRVFFFFFFPYYKIPEIQMQSLLLKACFRGCVFALKNNTSQLVPDFCLLSSCSSSRPRDTCIHRYAFTFTSARSQHPRCSPAQRCLPILLPSLAVRDAEHPLHLCRMLAETLLSVIRDLDTVSIITK